MVARMQVDEPIEGVCDNDNVIVILPIPGNKQEEAQPPLTDEELTEELNNHVHFLHNKPEYNDEGMVNMIINCKGEMVQCEIDNKTKNSELDEQIVAVFAEMQNWVPGKINGRAIDTAVLYSFEIKNGKIILD